MVFFGRQPPRLRVAWRPGVWIGWWLLVAPWAAAGQDLVIEGALVLVLDEVEVPSQEAGQLVELVVRAGSRVTAGQVLARLEDSEAQLALARAEQELAIARRKAESDVRVRFAAKSREVAEAEWQRGRESVEKYKKSLSQTELDRLRLEAERAALELEQAQLDQELAAGDRRLKELERDLAQRGLERRRLVAPLAGVVVELERAAGEWVQPGQRVLRIVRTDRLRVEGFVAATQATEALVGAAASLSLAGEAAGTGTFVGQVVFVSPEIEPVNGQVRLWAEVENRESRLRPGLQGRLRIGPGAPNP